MRKFLLSSLLALSLLGLPVGAFAQSDEKTITTAGADCSVTTRCAVFGVNGYPSIGVYLNVGVSGTFAFEATTDSDPDAADTIWVAINDDVGGVGSATADSLLLFSNPGYTYIRLRASAISGAATVIASRGFTGLRTTASLSGAAQGDGAIQDGVSAAIEATVADLTNSNPLATMIVDANGTQITSFGGGTQYTEGDTDATITGTALLIEGAANTLVVAPGTAADGLLVNLGANNDVTVTGTVTANLGATDNAVLDDIADGIPVTNAGTFVVQENGAALTALQLIDNLVVAEDAVAGNGFSGIGMLVVRQDSQVDLCADGDFCPPTVDADGNLRVTMAAGSGGTALADDADFTAGTTSFTPTGGFYQSTVTACTDGDTCAFGITAQRTMKVTLFSAAGSELTPGTDYVHNAALTADSTGGPAVMMLAKDFDGSALPNTVSAEGDAVLTAGSLFGVQYVMLTNEDGSAVGTVTVGSITAGDNDIGNVDLEIAGTGIAANIGSPSAQTIRTVTSSLPLPFKTLDLDETEEEADDDAGEVCGAWVTNTATATRWLKFYNADADDVTVGTTAPDITIGIPGNSSDDISAHFTTGSGGCVAFSTAITVAATTGFADNDTGAPGANEVILTLFRR